MARIVAVILLALTAPTHHDFDEAPTVVPQPTVEQPTMCLDGSPFKLLPTGWECVTQPVGGYLPGDSVCIGRRGCFTVDAGFLRLVSLYFPVKDQRWAVRAAACESEFVASADNHHGYAGYFQQHKRSFPGRERAALAYFAARNLTWSTRGVLDPESNVATSAWLLAEGGRRSWTCKGTG